MRSRRRPIGFTLIELLVVVAIIALLAALVLPALKNARLAARNTQLVSNLRQVAQSLYLYAQDFGDKFPAFQDSVSPGNAIIATHWQFKIGPYVHDPVWTDPKYSVSAVISRSLLHDPLDDVIGAPYYRLTRNIAINGSSFGDAGDPYYVVQGASNRRLADSKYPTELMLVGPGVAASEPSGQGSEWGWAARLVGWVFYTGGFNFSDWCLRFHHSASYALVDGHVERKARAWLMQEGANDAATQSRFFDSAHNNGE